MREPAQTVHRRDVLAGGAASLMLLTPAVRAVAATERPPLFATDVRLPGLLHAVVARPPTLGARLARLDASQALRIKSVVDVIKLAPAAGPALVRLGGAAVLAHDTWSALKGRDCLDLAWTSAPDGAAWQADAAQGDFVPATAEPLFEPPSATLQAGLTRCEAWACVREPERARAALAARLGLAVEAVALRRTASACAPDRFSNEAYLFEAARLSRAMRGAPVSLIWTRADDLPFRTRAPLA